MKTAKRMHRTLGVQKRTRFVLVFIGSSLEKHTRKTKEDDGTKTRKDTDSPISMEYSSHVSSSGRPGGRAPASMTEMLRLKTWKVNDFKKTPCVEIGVSCLWVPQGVSCAQ